MKKVLLDKRIWYFDYLRIAAIVAVVILHVASQNWYTTDVSSLEWNTFNVYDSLMRWGVPVFVMISGALFLGKEQTITKLYKKNIFRVLLVLIIWTIIYTLWRFLAVKDITTVGDIVSSLATEPYYLWFLYMLIGLYVVVPLLNPIVKDKKNTEYFLLLSLVFCFLIPEILEVIALKSELVAGIIEDKLAMMRLFMVMGYVGYFVLGYYLNTVTVKKKAEVAIYIAGVLGAIVTIIASSLLSNKLGEANAMFYDNLTINVAAMSIAVFVFFKNHLNTAKTQKALQLLSRCSLGVYLVHVIVLNTLDLAFGLNSLSFNPIIAVPALSLLTLAISYLVAIVLYKIPVIGKWIV